MLPLYFPRDKIEEEIAISKLPADVGDENGETVIDERKIRIKPLPNLKKNVPKPSQTSTDLAVSNIAAARRLVSTNMSFSHFDSYLSSWKMLKLYALCLALVLGTSS